MRLKANPRMLTAQEFINIEAIEQNILRTKAKLLFTFIRVKGQDCSLLDKADNQKVTEQLAIALAEQTEPFQILSVPRTIDVRGMLHELKDLRERADNGTRLLLLDGEIDALEQMGENGAKEPLIFLKLWQKAAPGADTELLQRTAKLTKQLCSNDITATIMDDEQILHLCSIYAELGIWQEEDTDTDIPILRNFPRLFTRKPTPQQQAEYELREQITPMGGLFFRPDHFMVGSAWCRCYGVSRYPAEVDYNWAAKLTCSTDCITCITYHPGMEGLVADQLSKSINRNNSQAKSEKDIRRKKSYERKVVAADKMIDELDGAHKAVGQISVLVMPFAQSKEDLEKICKTVLDRYKRRRMKLKLLPAVQKDSFKQLSPYYPDQQIINDMLQRIFPLETLVGGYPMTINTLRDDHGFYFGRTQDYGIVTFDPRVRNPDRTNGIGIVSGKSGKGKSTFMKHYIQSLYMMGFKIFIIDPEREYRDLCKELGGAWYDAGGGKAKLNPLQVQAPIPDDEESPMFQSSDSALSQHIQTVQMVLKCKIPSISDTQMALFTRGLRELYEQYGITMDWEFEFTRSPQEYPTMEELYRLLLEKASVDTRYEDLALLIEDMAIGADAVIWNGHTNIDMSNNVVVVDTNRLQYSSDSNRVAQYYNFMRMGFSAMSADRCTPFALFSDESQILFDPKFPQISMDMRNMVLRARKYEGYVWLSFPFLKTLKDEKISLYGQPILDTADYKILFNTDGQNLKDTVELFHLTESEEQTLEHLQRGEALALLGSQHLKVAFVIPKYKLQLMGTAGGR